jgi:hypothetical protein
LLHHYLVPHVNRVHAVSLTNPSWSGRTLTGTVSAGGFFKVGDVFYASGNGAENWFYVSAYTSGTGAITLQAMFNYRWAGATYTMFNTSIPTVWYYFPKGMFDPVADETKFFKTTAGSNVVEIVDGAGAAAARPAGVTVDSKPLWFHGDTKRLANALPLPSAATVSSVATNSITMSANALTSGTWAMCPGIVKVK